ncbi:hypothetical protein CBM2629_A290143 [Cupriavidus taiwanensis]|nr:hypothetical protein CBM2629_A290143 [Cupriavidus taiwanensis]
MLPLQVVAPKRNIKSFRDGCGVFHGADTGHGQGWKPACIAVTGESAEGNARRVPGAAQE